MKSKILRDIQNESSDIPKNIDKVGIRELRLPYSVYMRNGNIQHTIADISAYVTLTSDFRGINMSRIPQILHKHVDKAISSEYVDLVLEDLRTTLESPSSYLKIRFPYFLEKESPVKHVKGYMYYPCIFEGESKDNLHRHYLTVNVDYTSLCECSKEISERGAHNQRSTASIKIAYAKEDTVWIEELVELVEKHASSPIFSILKREDEKWVTEHAYDNPRFVETMARRLACDLEKNKRILGFTVVINHYESIHQYNAVAVIHGGLIYIP